MKAVMSERLKKILNNEADRQQFKLALDRFHKNQDSTFYSSVYKEWYSIKLARRT